jgi:hypothetical protein
MTNTDTDPNALRYVVLEDRGVLSLTGEDRLTFLQGLISSDVRRLNESRALHAAFLTPQGRYIHDFFLAACDDAWLVEAERSRLADLQRRLRVYRLRSKVTLADASEDWSVAALFGPDTAAVLGLPEDEPGAAKPRCDGVAFMDPRLALGGARLIVPRERVAAAAETLGAIRGRPEDYDRHRIALGLPDGSRDMQIEKALLLECGFDELHGVDWDKGCYIGQEVTARTRYRGLIKKRLLPVAVDGPLPPPGTPILADGKEAGEIRSGLDDRAMALLRLEALDDAAHGRVELVAGETRIMPRPPDWMRWPQPA